jgi:hypothetical protein
MLHPNRLPVFLFASALLGMAVAASPDVHAATVVIVNNDGAGEGFNDPTAAAPVGGNTGTTVGAQRLIAFQRAADIWAARLRSNVPIRVSGQWNPLSCTDSGGVLGSAGFPTSRRDFTGAPVAGTWYAIALANALFGSDLDAGDDINATFNGNWGTAGCGSASGWYYGLDGNPPANRIDFVVVLLHELGHGLGFASLVNLATGAKAMGFDDAYMRFLENHGASPSDYPSMTDAQRVAASIATGNLHWTGANVRALSGNLTAGTVGDHVRMFAPNPQQPGSSVSHWDTAVTPNQLMEPAITVGLPHNTILEEALFRDIGWTTPRSTHDFSGEARSDIAWRQTGGATALWLMNGATVTSASIGTVATNWQIVGQRDFNGDGRHDLLWRDNATGATAIWFLNGGTVSSTASVGTVSTTWTVAGTGDFNGDGRGDLLWRDTAGNTAIWLLNGAQVVQTAGIGTVPSPWIVAGVADFNGDGKADLLWRNTSTGATAIWFINGVAVASSATIATVPTTWSIVATGDFNGDGKADIVWRDTTGNVAVWLMNGTAVLQTGGLGLVSANWSIVETGDFNGDGKSDLLWRDTSGNVAIWFLNGVTVSSTAGVATVGADWAIQNVNVN